MAESRPPAFGIARPEAAIQDVTSDRLLLGDEAGRGSTLTQPGADIRSRSSDSGFVPITDIRR